MAGIFDTNEPFDFNKLVLTNPTLISGGNYFIRCLVDNSPLYIQPPKCKTKQGILKAGVGKRYYTDLMFTNEDAKFIQWMENLENYCQQFIFKNREKWFDGEMELHDIENYFTSPLKIFKSGKFYIARTNISTVLNKVALKIYDESENEVAMETIDDKTNVTTILEIQGIKCSTRCFQIELELKQLMVMNPDDLFQKCIIKGVGGKPFMKSSYSEEPTVQEQEREKECEKECEKEREKERERVIPNMELIETLTETDIIIDTNMEPNQEDENGDTANNEDVPDEVVENIQEEPDLKVDPNEMQEVEFNLEELADAGEIQIKKRNDVYYEMYREARRKAKIARDLALSSYLEVKRIKNTYMLDDLKDSDDSDLDMNDDDENDSDEEPGILPSS
jgi:hypothetical protein